MKMKTIIAVAALVCVSAASASTNYVNRAVRRANLVGVVQEMSGDSELADAAAFRRELERVDAAMAKNCARLSLRSVSRRFPLTAKAVLGRTAAFSEKVKGEILAHCGYDAPNWTLELVPGEVGYVNFVLQGSASGQVWPIAARNAALRAAVVPTRRWIRAEGGTFVGKAGAEKVKLALDELAAELNAPRFGKAGEILAKIGVAVEWDEVQRRLLTDEEVSKAKSRLLNGAVKFDTALQNKLCIALGVDGYNAFVREYNEGKKGTGKREEGKGIRD